MILLDTNVIIHYLKGIPEIVERLESTSRNELAIPAIAIYELEYGTLRSRVDAKRRTALQRGLANIQHIPFDDAAALAAARIRFELETAGRTIGPMDLLIAGIATSRGATLVTSNVDEFSRINGLRVLNWRDA